MGDTNLLEQPLSWEPPATIEALFATTANNKWSSINSAVAGAREERELPEGPAPVQLYSIATPNGQKVGILFEELGIDYDAHVIQISKGDQFTSGFVAVNPNSKIPAAIDREGANGTPVRLFESASILQYFAEKHGKFIPSDPERRAECFNWVYWQMGGFGPMCGQFGHFFVYAPPEMLQARSYGVARYGMEVQRLCSVLDKHLDGKEFILDDEYSIADMVIFPWFHCLMKYYKHASGVNAYEFLNLEQYQHIMAWVERLLERPAVQRGLSVCGWDGVGKPWLNAEKPEES